MASPFVVGLFILLTSPQLSVADFFSVNKIIGDLSFKEKYGSVPSPSSSEIHRIQTHLEYVEQLIRRQTQAKNNSSKKLEALDHLNDYWKKGQFPQHNTSFNINDNRKPRFIDQHGIHCAVGYLIVKSSGFEHLPNEINLQNEYSYIDEIQNENLQKWMDLYGYTSEELSLIQPTYEHIPHLRKKAPKCVPLKCQPSTRACLRKKIRLQLQSISIC